MKYHNFFCAIIISVKFNEPADNKTLIIIKPIEKISHFS